MWKYLKCGASPSPQVWICTLAASSLSVGRCSWCALHLLFIATFHGEKHEQEGSPTFLVGMNGSRE